MINKSLSLMLGLSLLLGLGLTYGLKADDEADSGGHGYGPVAVSLASVQQISLPQQLDAVGELEAAVQIAVAAETSGRVTALHFDSGQQVKAGELLVQLNDAVEQAELLQQEAQLLAAESAYRRLVSLAADNLASREALDNALAERDMARAAVARTQAQIAQKAIKAPFSGTLGIRKIHLGQYLGAGETIAQLVDNSQLKINFAISEAQADKLELGQTLQLRTDLRPDESWPAKLSAIEPIVGSSRMLQLQAILLPKPIDGESDDKERVDDKPAEKAASYPSQENGAAKLRAGMFARVALEKSRRQALMIPESAITYNTWGETVFRVDAGEQSLTAHKVAVKTGQRQNGWVEVISGLSLEQLVVTSGQLRLSDGVQVSSTGQDSLTAALLYQSKGQSQ
ncbi:efflux RND transporter periplasmic adaptor subunit [Shewanella algae]|uniref:efflux RND transporter periplasmic adaptor subunit n=1 Tax=Shewanella algae TaxID=38313 RepID=UPI0031F5BB3F